MQQVTAHTTTGPARHHTWIIAMLLVGASACSASDDSSTTTSSTLPDSCNEVTTTFAAGAATDAPTNDCREWISKSSGRAVLGSVGSASVWSRNTGHGTALIVGAVHTLGEGWFGPAGSPIEETLWDPADQVGVLRLYLRLSDGSATDPEASPLFMLYNPAIAPERNGNRMRDVLPSEDFYVAATDSQKYDVSGPSPTPEPIVHGLVPLHDPSESTLATPTFAQAEDGELVMLLGYPNETRELTAAVGRVMTETEAFDAVVELAEGGDPEGSIPYHADVEMFIEGAAMAGMSGGPVVDRDGRIVGVMVRATDEHNGVQYVRAVRVTYVASQLDQAFDALPAQRQSAIAGYLER